MGVYGEIGRWLIGEMMEYYPIKYMVSWIVESYPTILG
jgi:hypothetical protein